MRQPDASRSCTGRQGFNLVEAAIVLGVIGLVIGGIWVAAAAITRTMRINETRELAVMTLSAIEGIYKGLPLPNPEEDITDTLMKAGVIAGRWVVNGQATHAWGGRIVVTATGVFGRTATLEFRSIPRRECIGLALALLKIAPGTGGTTVRVNNNDAFNHATVNARCLLAPDPVTIGIIHQAIRL